MRRRSPFLRAVRRAGLHTRPDPNRSGSAGVQDHFFHQDDLFNVVLVIDSAGDAAERYEYGDYGAPFYFTGAGSSVPSSAINNTRLYNGREWDDESRCYYYRTRYLEPTMGRFTTRDVIGPWGDRVRRLISAGGGEKAALFATDPAYLVGYDSVNRRPSRKRSIMSADGRGAPAPLERGVGQRVRICHRALIS